MYYCVNDTIWNLTLCICLKEQDKDAEIETEDENKTVKQINNRNKNLRFFGDTDQESVTSILPQPGLQTLRRYKSNNNSNNSNGMSSGSISSRLQTPSRSPRVTGLRHHRSAGDVATSSAESTTEGDSSQQSQRSVVYLHAATGETKWWTHYHTNHVTARAVWQWLLSREPQVRPLVTPCDICRGQSGSGVDSSLEFLHHSIFAPYSWFITTHWSVL
jgi:hypothetical protein